MGIHIPVCVIHMIVYVYFVPTIYEFEMFEMYDEAMCEVCFATFVQFVTGNKNNWGEYCWGICTP